MASPKFERERIKEQPDEREAIQKKTFTKWLNTFLDKDGGLHVNDIFTDLGDGRILIRLLEILSGEKISYVSTEKLRINKTENVDKALAFLQQKKVNLENIGAEDIVDCNPCLMLGLIWTIILHFQIEEVEVEMEGESSETKSAKKALLLWCQRNTAGYDGVEVTNFSSSWRSGLAFNALIHKHRPDLINYEGLQSNSALVNLNNAFDVAFNELGISKLLDAEDMDCQRPDDKSIMIYLVSYFHYFSKIQDEENGGRRLNKLKLEECHSTLSHYHDDLMSLHAEMKNCVVDIAEIEDALKPEDHESREAAKDSAHAKTPDNANFHKGKCPVCYEECDIDASGKIIKHICCEGSPYDGAKDMNIHEDSTEKFREAAKDSAHAKTPDNASFHKGKCPVCYEECDIDASGMIVRHICCEYSPYDGGPPPEVSAVTESLEGLSIDSEEVTTTAPAGKTPSRSSQEDIPFGDPEFISDYVPSDEEIKWGTKMTMYSKDLIFDETAELKDSENQLLNGHEIRMAIIDFNGSITKDSIKDTCLDRSEKINIFIIEDSGERKESTYKEHAFHSVAIAAGNKYGDYPGGIANGASVDVYLVDRRETIRNALKQIVEKEYDVLSVSMGSRYFSDPVWNEELEKMTKTVVIAAAGNEGTRCRASPSTHLSVISVGSITYRGSISYFSPRNADVYCYGEVKVPNSDGKTCTHKSRGTSLATPAIAGLVCIILQILKKTNSYSSVSRLVLTQLIKAILKKMFREEKGGIEDNAVPILRSLSKDVDNFLKDHKLQLRSKLK